MKAKHILGATLIAALAGSQALAKTVTVTFGSTKGPDEIKIYQRLISEFESLNPGIKVKIQLYSGDFREKLLMQFVAGNAPDCFETGLEDFPLYPKNGYLLPLNGYAKSSDLRDFPKQLIKTFSYKDKLYALTRDVAPLVMIHNKRMFSQAGVPYPSGGWTWDSYTGVLSKFRTDANGDGKPDTYGFAGAPWANFVWQAGGDIFDDEVNPRKLALARPEAIDAIQFAADLKFKYGVSSSPNWGDTGFFAQGKAATVIGGYWERVYSFKNAKFEWDAAPVPAGKVKATTMYTAAYSVNKVSKNPVAAYKWVEFVCSARGQREMAKMGLAVPSRLSIAKEVIPASTPPANGEAFIQALEYGRLAYQFGYRKPWADIEAGLAPVWSGKSTAAQAVEKLVRPVESLLSRLR